MYYSDTCALLASYGIVWHGKAGLGPCNCRFGDPRLSALADAMHWCQCDPETTFLAAYEATQRGDASYARRAVFVRSLFALKVKT